MFLTIIPPARTAEPANPVDDVDAETNFYDPDALSIKEIVSSQREPSAAQKVTAQRYVVPNFDVGKTYTVDRPKVKTSDYLVQGSNNNDTCIYPDFSSVNGLTLNGDADWSDNNNLRLTPAEEHRVGSAWCNNKQFIQSGFRTTFQFQIIDGSGRGEGLAFVVQNDDFLAFGDAAGGIGYNGITNSLAIEFDTQLSGTFDDPDINHISVHTRGTEANSAHLDYSLGYNTSIPDMSDGQVHTVTIEYVSGTMKIFMDSSPALTVSVDLSTTLNLDSGTAWVGFTSATGDQYENHDILNWAFYPAFDLSVSKSGPAGAAEIGTNLTYTITVANNGPLETTGLVLTDTLPLSVTFDLDSVTPSQGGCSETSTLTAPHFICNLNTLDAGAIATVTASIIPTTTGIITNTARVAGDETDPNLGDNTAIVHTPVCIPPKANFTAGPELAGCRPLHVYFTDTSTGTVTSWSWTFGDLGSSERQHPDHTYWTGNYTVTLTASCYGFYPDTITRTHYITVVKPAPPEARNVYITPESPADDDANLTLYYEYYDWCNKPEGDTRIGWTRDGQIQFAFDNRHVVSSSITLPGERWCAAVIPHNGYESGDTVEDCVYIEYVPNHPPQAHSVTITPTFPTDFDDLELTYVYTDADKDLEDENSTELRWYRDGILQQGSEYSTTTVPSSTTDLGETWYATVRPHDGKEFGEVTNSNPVTIRPADNYPPEAISVTITPTQPQTLDDLNLSYTCSDRDDAPEKVTAQLRWYRDGVLQPTYNDVTIVPAINTWPEEDWYATVRCYDGKDYSTREEAAQVTITRNGNTPPEVWDVRIVPARPGDDSDLHLLYTYRDVDGDDETGSRIHWYKNWKAQTDYNGLTVIPSSIINVSDTWYARVTPYDGRDYGAPVAAHSVTVQPNGPINTPPEALDVFLSPGLPGDDNRLKLYYTYYDLDGDPEGATVITWTFHVPPYITYTNTYTNQTFVPADATSVDEVWCAGVTPYDGQEYGDLVKSDCVTVALDFSNTPPETRGDVYIEPGHPRLIDRMRLYYVYFDVDNDSEGDSRIRWHRNGQVQPAYNDLTVVPAGVASRGEQWFATVQVHDGIYYGATVTTSEILINRLPQAQNAHVLLPEPPTCQAQVSYEYDDPDGDPPGAPQIWWYCDAVHQQDYDDMEHLPYTATLPGQDWYAKIAPYDGYEYGYEVTATAVTIITECVPPPPPPVVITINLPILLRNHPEPQLYEVNDKCEQAYGPLFPDQAYDAYPEDIDDWYYLDITDTLSIHVLVTNHQAVGQLLVYHESDCSTHIGQDGRNPGSPTKEVPNEVAPDDLKNLSPGRYYIRVYSSGGRNTNHLYRLIVTYKPPDP
jgi:uncharacterized repeat protein (TIGR01451 family)